MATGAPVVCSVLTEDLDLFRDVAVPVGGHREMDVSAGAYLVRARLPSGAAFSTRAVARPDEVSEVHLGRVGSPHEWLELQALIGSVDSQHPGAAPAAPEEPLLPAWIRQWSGNGAGWEVRPFAPARMESEGFAVLRMDASGEGRRLLQLGGEEVPWRLVALPPSPEVEVLIRRSPHAPAEISVATTDRRAEMLLGYLSHGQVGMAGVIAGESPSDMALESEQADPAPAAILGYYLLRAGPQPSMLGWTGTLADRFPSLPDGCVIDGWAHLRAVDPPELVRGRSRLLEAAGRGVPAYTEGLRLLYHGLRLLRQETPDDQEVEDALARVGAYAAATDWTMPVTSFTGSHPDAPSLVPALGIPDDPGLLWVGREGPPPPPAGTGRRPRWPRWLAALGVAAGLGAGALVLSRPDPGALPEVAVEPGSLDFGDQAVGGPGPAGTVTVTGRGPVAVRISSADLTGPQVGDFAITSDTCTGASLGEELSCTVLVTFSPSGLGERQATLLLEHEGTDGRAEVTLAGVGTEGGAEQVPAIDVEPGSVVFSAPEETADLIISNDGTGALDLAQIRLEPPEEEKEFLIQPSETEPCGETIEPGASCAVRIVFLPQRGGTGMAGLLIESNATEEPLQVPLSGTPAARVGKATFIEDSADVAMANTGTARVDVSLVEIVGEDASRFSIAGNGCGSLLIGDTCTITVEHTFPDDASDGSEATLLIHDGTAESPHRVALSVPPPPIVD
jgi:hypothetical protein